MAVSIVDKPDMMKKLMTLFLLLNALYHPALMSADATPQANDQKAVLVTGATRGIGAKITEHLSGQGYFVYAGARKDEDMARLDKMPNVKSVRLDVTMPEQIAAAVASIEQAGRGLYGVVNNAGLTIVESMVKMSEEDFNTLMQVNVYGPYRVTRAVAPLIVSAKGRIVTIGSKGGLSTVPRYGAYSMTKHAMEAFTDALAMEMGKQGVKASIIEPGNFSPWGGGDPILVARAVEHALFDAKPKRRYLVTPNEKSADKAIEKSIIRLLQVNQQHEYSADLDELIQVLSTQYKKIPGKPKE